MSITPSATTSALFTSDIATVISPTNSDFTSDIKRPVLILSNDRFRQYDIVTEDWLREHQIRFMIIENQFYFEQKFVKLVEEVLNENSLELNKILREKQSIEG